MTPVRRRVERHVTGAGPVCVCGGSQLAPRRRPVVGGPVCVRDGVGADRRAAGDTAVMDGDL